MDAEDRTRIARHLERVLERLRRGPATNHELRELAGSRAMGRVNELQKAGYAIDVRKESRSTWRVTLTPVAQSLF